MVGKCSKCKQEEIAAAYLCPMCFWKEHGISVETYKANKKYKTEKPQTVAERLNGYAGKALAPEKQEPTQETQTAPLTFSPKIPVTNDTRMVAIPEETYQRLMKMAEEEYRPVGYQLAYMLKKAGLV